MYFKYNEVFKSIFIMFHAASVLFFSIFYYIYVYFGSFIIFLDFNIKSINFFNVLFALFVPLHNVIWLHSIKFLIEPWFSVSIEFIIQKIVFLFPFLFFLFFLFYYFHSHKWLSMWVMVTYLRAIHLTVTFLTSLSFNLINFI